MLRALLTACIVSFTSLAWAQSCPSEGLFLQVLGSGGPELSDQRASSAYLLLHDGKPQVLIDFGTGAANNLGLAGVDIADVNYLLFSHFHSDHSADFAALIKASFFVNKTTDMHVYGPTGSQFFASARDFVQRSIGANGVYPYLQGFLNGQASYQVKTYNIAPSDTPQVIRVPGMTFTAVDAKHGPVPSLAWRVEVAGKSVVFSGDNSGTGDNLSTLAKGADLLVAHNAVPEGAKGVATRLHMMPSRMGEIAQQAQVKSLLLSHFMSRTLGQETHTQAAIERSYKGPLAFAVDMQCIEL